MVYGARPQMPELNARQLLTQSNATLRWVPTPSSYWCPYITASAAGTPLASPLHLPSPLQFHRFPHPATHAHTLPHMRSHDAALTAACARRLRALLPGRDLTALLITFMRHLGDGAPDVLAMQVSGLVCLLVCLAA